MIFANIEYLFLLLLLIPYIVWYVMRRKKTEPTMQVSTTRMYMQLRAVGRFICCMRRLCFVS